MLQWRVVVTGVLIALVGYLALAIITTLEPPAELLVSYIQTSGGYNYTITITPNTPSIPIPLITPTIEQVKAFVGGTPIECQVSPRLPIILTRTVSINIHCPVLVGRIVVIMDSGEFTISIGYSSNMGNQLAILSPWVSPYWRAG
jgi:hypothetical protein